MLPVRKWRWETYQKRRMGQINKNGYLNTSPFQQQRFCTQNPTVCEHPFSVQTCRGCTRVFAPHPQLCPVQRFVSELNSSEDWGSKTWAKRSTWKLLCKTVGEKSWQKHPNMCKTARLLKHVFWCASKSMNYNGSVSMSDFDSPTRMPFGVRQVSGFFTWKNWSKALTDSDSVLKP